MPIEFPDNGFGVPSDNELATGLSINQSVQTADKTDRRGTILEQTTYGQTKEVTEDAFLATADFDPEATELQVGTDVITSHNAAYSNTGYATTQLTRRIVPGDASATTTTTTPGE